MQDWSRLSKVSVGFGQAYLRESVGFVKSV